MKLNALRYLNLGINVVTNVGCTKIKNEGAY